MQTTHWSVTHLVHENTLLANCYEYTLGDRVLAAVIYSGKLSRERTFEFRDFVAICKSFLSEIGRHGIFWRRHQ